MEYKRVFEPGGTYFFTVVTHIRQPFFSDENAINTFKICLLKTKRDYPFKLDAIVILPDHIHTIWTLPENDANYPLRWRLIKASFSHHWAKEIKNPLEKSPSWIKKSEITIWQRRYWEHSITNEEDYHQRLEYVFYNPVKHGYVNDPKDWQYSFLINNTWYYFLNRIEKVVYVGVSGIYHDILKAEKSDEYEPAAVIGESVTKQIFIRVGSLLQKSR